MKKLLLLTCAPLLVLANSAFAFPTTPLQAVPPSGDTSGNTDTNNINAACQAWGMVSLQNGDYYTSTGLQCPVIEGQGNNLAYFGNATGTKVHAVSGPGVICPGNGVACSYKDFTIALSAGMPGITVTGVTQGLDINEMTFKDPGGNGSSCIALPSGVDKQDLKVVHSYFLNCGQSNTSSAWCIDGERLDDSTIEDSNLNFCGAGGILITAG